MEYWLDELATKEKGTRVNYQRYFKDFLKFVNMTADEVLAQRIRDTASQDRKTQRRFESLLLKFIAYEKERGYAPLTLQTIWASIRSFFEIHYYPLIMRKKDYPKGDSNGVRRATKEAVLKVLESNPRNKTTLTALIMAFKDSGLRVSDMRLLKCARANETRKNETPKNKIPNQERYEHFRERERMKEESKKLLSPKGAIVFSEH